MANTTLSIMVENKGFATRKLTAEQISSEKLQAWTLATRKLQTVAYSAFTVQHDTADALELSPVFDAFKEALALVLAEGEKVRCDNNTAQTLVAMSVSVKNVKAQEILDAQSVVRERKNALKTMEQINGVQESALESLRESIKDAEKAVEELKKQANQVTKDYVKATEKDFQKRVEDYIAELYLGRTMKTNEQIAAEAEAKKKARAEKQKAKRQAKKAQEKEQKASAQDASVQAQVNANA